MDNTQRTVLKLVTGGFQKITFDQLQKGDLFSLIEPDGKPVVYNNSVTLEACSDPFKNKDGVWEIVMQNYKPKVYH